MNRIWICCLIFTLSLGSAAWSQEKKTGGGTEKAIVGLEQQIRRAVIKGDTSILERYLADDFVGIGPNGEAADKSKTIQELKDGTVKYVAHNFHSPGPHQKLAVAVSLSTRYAGRKCKILDPEQDLRKQIRKTRWTFVQIQLSPAHPDFGKVGFAELEDRIRKRAYQLYEKRGYAHGHALDDWLEAKAEVLGVTKGESYLENMSATPVSRAA